MKLATMLFSIIVLSSNAALASDEKEKRFFPTEEEKNTPFFDRQSWVSTTHIAYYGPEDTDNRDIQMALLNIGAEHYPWKNVGIVADAYLAQTRGYVIVDDDPTELDSDAFGIGGSLGLKWHILRGRNWSVFVNGTIGFLFTDKDFPAGGTRWNFMERADLGITVRLKEQWHLMASGSLVHASNGRGLNNDNPSFSGAGGYVGVVYRFDTLGLFD